MNSRRDHRQFESRVAVHDRNHVEIKLEYTAPVGTTSCEYRVDTYFFVPSSLGLTPSTYPKERFFSDVQRYVRLKTPTVPLSALLDEKNEHSPLADIRALLDELARQAHPSPGAERKLGRELKLFGCMVRAAVRDGSEALREDMAEVDRADGALTVIARDLSKAGRKFIDRIDRALGRYRKLRVIALGNPMPEEVRETYRAVDEYMSWVVEWGMTRLLRTIDESMGLREPFSEVRARAIEQIRQERAYRSGCGYRVDEEDDPRRERFLYRSGLLKKFVNSVLWLDVSRRNDADTMSDVGAAIAAGVAMLFAALAAVFHAKWFVLNTSGFIVAVVITYMLKDRIKDWLKRVLSRKMLRWVADISTRIEDPTTGAAIGRCREAFAYLPRARVPQVIREVRMHGTDQWIEDREKPETVFKYEKAIRLDHAAMNGRLHQEQHDVSDILRFDVSSFAARTDDPTSVVANYDEALDRVVERVFAKVYHVNLVLVLTADEEDRPAVMRRVRVVFDKSGIVRLEEPGVPITAAAHADVAAGRLIRSPAR